ncbi:MAG TPA: hypothetical protein VHA05_01100 [Candidatus Saccharimonadales bacterium]|nr:hypothetical protein [Candidatus Saccharimonadales bacterium]
MGFLKNIRSNLEAKRAAAEAAANARREQLEKEYRDEMRKARAPVLDKLEKYAGRLILVTNPSDDAYDIERRHNPIAEAINNAMASDTSYRVSLHAGTSPHSGRGIVQGTQFIVDRLRELTAGEVSYLGSVQSLGSERGINPSSLQQALEEGVYGPSMDSSPNIAHIAVTTALGIEDVNLDYFNARYGDSFVYLGADENNDMRWEKIFSSVE